MLGQQLTYADVDGRRFIRNYIYSTRRTVFSTILFQRSMRFLSFYIPRSRWLFISLDNGTAIILTDALQRLSDRVDLSNIGVSGRTILRDTRAKKIRDTIHRMRVHRFLFHLSDAYTTIYGRYRN